MRYKFKTPGRATELAYKALRLVDPATPNKSARLGLGHVRIIENEAAVLAIVDEYIKELIDVSHAIDREYPRTSNQHGEVLAEFGKRCILSYADFCRFEGHGEAEQKKDHDPSWRKGAAMVRLYARNNFARVQVHGGFSRTFPGYRSYLKAVHPKLHEKLDQQLRAFVPEEPRRTHSYILSTTGTGKSELLKAIIRNYSIVDGAGVVVLDPGGDMAEQISRWDTFTTSNQLVYIDPMLSEYNVPVINPFDAEQLSDQDRNLLTEQIVHAIGSLVDGKLGGSLSVNMEAILYPSVRLLVDLPNTSLLDLQALMKDDEDLIEAGRRSGDPLIADFFQTEFTQMSNLKQTKNSIVTKLRNILGKGVLDKVLCGQTSIDLERLMAENKIIVFNLAKGRLGSAESSALGTLVVSLIQAIAMKRERIKESERPMTHLIIDECQNFVTGSVKDIVRETRKFGLAVTLAQQEVGAEMPGDIKDAVIKNTNIKVAGRSTSDETKVTGDLVDIPGEIIKNLPTGQFYWKAGTAPPVLLHVRQDLLKYRKGIDNEQWIKRINQMQQIYYRRLDGQEHQAKSENKTADNDPQPTGKRQYDFR